MNGSSVTLDKVEIQISASAGQASENINQLTETLSNLRSATKGGLSNLSKLNKGLEELKSSSEGIKTIGINMKSLDKIGDGFKNLSNVINDKGFKRAQKANEEFFKSLSRGSSNIISKVKQIGLSLLGTRTIFTATRKAVSEYMAMDAELTWRITNNWRALGAQLAPAIEYVTWVFKQFVRVVYSVILALTGIDLIARANEKAMRGWGKAAKDTLGNLQKFDDLNVVEFPKGSGNDNKLIELDTIDLSPIQKVIDWVRKLRDEIKEAWNSGQWEGVGTVLADGLNGAMNTIDFKRIEESFENVAKHFGDFLGGVVNNFDWSLFGTKLTEALSIIPRMIATFLNNIPWENIGNGLNEALKTIKPDVVFDAILGSINSLVLGIQSALLRIDAKVLGKKISDGMVSILSNFGELLSKIEWEKIGVAIRDVIENIDWKTIWEKVVTIFKEAFGGIGDFFDGILGKDGLGTAILAGIGTIFAVDKGIEFAGVLGDIGEKASGLVKALGLLGKNTLSTETISGITNVGKPLLDMLGALGPSLPIIAAVIAGIVVLGTAIADLWKNNEKFRTTVAELFDSIKSAFVPIIEAVIKTIKELWKGVVVPLFDLLVDVAKPIIIAIVDILDVLWRNALQPIVEILSKIFGAIMPPLTKAIEGVINVLTWLWDNLLSPLVNFLLDYVVATIQLLTGDVEGAMETMSGAFLNVIDAAKNLWEKVIGFFKKIADGIKERIDKIKKDWNTFWDTLKNSPQKMLQGLINTLNSVIDRINSKLSISIGEKTAKLLQTLGVNGINEGKYQIFSIPKIPALETGTNKVPYEGIYHLHPDEAVVPKKYNPAVGGGTNEETNERLDRLIYILENLDTTTVVNLGNRELLRQQQRYNKSQNDKYGTDINF